MERRTVVMPARKNALTKEYIAELRAQVKDKMNAITQKPTLQELYSQVDTLWSDPIFLRQTKFENKDQHYSYITQYFKDYIEPITLDEYKKLVFADVMGRLDKAEALLESDKILVAAKAHKAQEEQHLKEYNDQLGELNERNERATRECLNKLTDSDINRIKEEG